MLGHLALLPLLALAPGALAAPVFKARSLPAPFHKIHARNAAPGVGSSEPSLLKPRLLGGILDPLTADIPIVGGLVDTTTDLLDGVVDTTTDLVGGVVDTATDIVGSVLDVALGININLDVGAFLTCGPVSGLFNDHQYDLGCSCAGAEGGLLLGLDVDVGAILNVVGLDAWVRAQIALGVGAYYPAHSYPTCDGNGGWNCPNGDCGSPSSSWSSASQTPAPTSVVIQSIEPSPSTTEWSSAPAPTSQWVEPTPSSSVSIWVAPGPTPAPSTSWVEPAPAAPTSTVWTEEVEDCDEDEDVGAYEEPTWEPEPTFTNYEAETTVTIPTAYVVEHTVTETATQWSTVTNTETQWSTITETATSTVTITECAPTTISVQSAPSPSPEAPAPAPSPSFSTQPTPVPSIEAVPSPTPSPSSTTSWQPVPSAVFYKECGSQQQYDIQLDLCVDLCVDALGLATVCADLDLNTGLDLPIVGPLLDGLL